MELIEYKLLTPTEIKYLREYIVLLSYDKIALKYYVTRHTVKKACHTAKNKLKSHSTLDSAIDLHLFELKNFIGFSRSSLTNNIVDYVNENIKDLKDNKIDTCNKVENIESIV